MLYNMEACHIFFIKPCYYFFLEQFLEIIICEIMFMGFVSIFILTYSNKFKHNPWSKCQSGHFHIR